MRIKRTAKTARANALKHLGMAASNVAIAAFKGEVDLDAGELALMEIKKTVEALRIKEGGEGC